MRKSGRVEWVKTRYEGNGKPQPCNRPDCPVADARGSGIPATPSRCARLCAMLILTAGAAAGQPRPAVQKLEVGSTVSVTGQQCQKCHEDILKSFPLSAHGKAAQFLNGAEASTCETCHGDGAKHSETERPSQISTPAKLPSAQASALCLNCHSSDQTHASWRGSMHDRKDLSCVSCHNEHHPKSPSKLLAKRTEMELCLTCHIDKRKATLQRSTHLFRTEHKDVKIGCASCHNPHGGEGRAMLAASSTNALCYTCHADKRGPFLWEHAPGRSDCNTCHVPHGSNNPNLLKARSSVLCQQCHMHMLWRHQTVAGYDVSSFNKGCVNCHSQVHGSNHPSGKSFTH